MKCKWQDTMTKCVLKSGVKGLVAEVILGSAFDRNPKHKYYVRIWETSAHPTAGNPLSSQGRRWFPDLESAKEYAEKRLEGMLVK